MSFNTQSVCKVHIQIHSLCEGLQGCLHGTVTIWATLHNVEHIGAYGLRLTRTQVGLLGTRHSTVFHSHRYTDTLVLLVRFLDLFDTSTIYRCLCGDAQDVSTRRHHEPDLHSTKRVTRNYSLGSILKNKTTLSEYECGRV